MSAGAAQAAARAARRRATLASPHGRLHPCTDLRGSRFERVNLTGAEFRASDLTGARFRGVDMSRVVMRGVELCRRRHPRRDREPDDQRCRRRAAHRRRARPALPRPGQDAPDRPRRLPRGVGRPRAAVGRDRRTGPPLPPELLHESVDGEWSFIETLRHLVFATDAWVRRAILGDPSPWDPLDLPWDEMPDTPGVPRDRDARPSLDERARAAPRPDGDRAAGRRRASPTSRWTATPNRSRGRAGRSPAATRCVSACCVILNEEWEHRLYAERDLDALRARGA